MEEGPDNSMKKKLLVSSLRPSGRKISAMKSLFETSSLMRTLDTLVEVSVPTKINLFLLPGT